MEKAFLRGRQIFKFGLLNKKRPACRASGRQVIRKI